MVGQNDSHPDLQGSPTGVDTKGVSQLYNGSHHMRGSAAQLSSRSDSGWPTHCFHAGADFVEENQKAWCNPEGMGSKNRKYRTASEASRSKLR